MYKLVVRNAIQMLNFIVECNTKNISSRYKDEQKVNKNSKRRFNIKQ